MPYRLFSITYTTGSFHRPAMFKRFVKRAGVHDRLAHEAEAHLIAAAILDREADAGAERHVRADDAVAAEEVEALVEHVHRAALAARAAIDAAEQLGHDGARRDAARERLTVIAIRRDDVVVGAQHRQRSGADRFLPDVEMAEAADLPERVRLGATLLEATLEQHRAEQLEVELGVGGFCWASDFFLAIELVTGC